MLSEPLPESQMPTELRSNGIWTSALNHSSGSDIPREAKCPFYVDNEQLFFKHDRSDLQIKVLSDWKKVEESMYTHTSVCPIYFPSSLELQYNTEIEARLAQNIREWRFFDMFSPALARVGVDLSRFASIQSHLSYDERILVQRHLTWIFLMDEVTERLPIYKLHATAGKMYRDNLKSIMRDEPIEDMTQFKGSCPDELIQTALNVQRIFAEDLMPLKKKLLSACHLQVSISTFDAYLDSQYDEGHRFCADQMSQDTLKTRVSTIGITQPWLFCMTTAQVQLHRIDDPILLHVSLCIAFFNDMIGLYKDLDSLKTQDDGSVYLNLVRASIREQGFSEEDALRFFAQRVNYFSRHFEFFISSYSHELQQFYLSMLQFMFNMFDYHLVGAQGKAQCRYGWKLCYT